MNTAEWILVCILSVTLFIFLVAGIILLINLIKFTKEAKKIIITGQSIATNVDGVVDNVKDMTSVSGLVKSFLKHYNNSNNQKSNTQKGKQNVKGENSQE